MGDTKRTRIIILTSLLAFGALSVGAFFSLYQSNWWERLFSDREDIVGEHIEKIRTEPASVSSAADEARLRRGLAENTMRFDTVGGYRMLREVATNETYPLSERMLAVQTMGDVYYNRSSRIPNFITTYVAIGEPYERLMRLEEGNDIAGARDAMKALYEYALSFDQRSPIAEYRIALWFLGNGEATEAKAHLERGDAVLSDFETLLHEQDQYMVGYAYRLRGTVLGVLSEFTGDPTLRKDARVAFERARSELRKETASGQFYDVELLWADLWFAMLLIQDDKPDEALVRELLAEIVRRSNPQFGFYRYLERLAVRDFPGEIVRGQREALATLASYDPGFFNMLVTMGWRL